VTATPDDELILCGFVMHGIGMHLGAWLASAGDAGDYLSPELYLDVARAAEAAKLQAMFFADGYTNSDSGTSRPCPALDPVMMLTLMAAVTSRLGLVATASTTFEDPYLLARRFGTLDHLSHGRAGWNLVTSTDPTAALQFGGGHLPAHADRYAVAREFIEVTNQLWDSWEEGALVGDKETAVFALAEKVHQINHKGEFFDVAGPLPFPRCPQGRPVIFQAGSSEEGKQFAARNADVVFTSQPLLEAAVDLRADLRTRAAAWGREPKILPGMRLHLGGTEAEARRRQRELDDTIGLGPELEKLAKRTGVPLEALEPDQKFPIHLLSPDEQFNGSVGYRQSLVSVAVKEDLTVRQLIERHGGGQHLVVGSPEQIADMMVEWRDAGAADGFNLMIDVLPSGLYDIRDMLVPELQRRGLFHKEYEHPTLRENLGLLPVGSVAPRGSG
jgi:FMN-dependent oxidoreductase (nitrilotriacetate monooxygenase family)